MSTPLYERRLANAIRVLTADAVQQANSGHPGAPMGMADIAEVVWRQFLKHNPANPQWPNRDRFVLSNGHGSMLQYALLHLTGYDLSIDDLRQFRQLHSRTPGHPEYGYTPGVETTTGPLGQGIANAVGFAIAEKTLAAQFNRDDLQVINHHTYCFLGDGCLMEGISHEVCSLAGTLKLGKLIAYYDANGISIDGNIEGWFTDDTRTRFEAYGWQVQTVDGHDTEAIRAASIAAIAEQDRPSLIICRTRIGLGSPLHEGKESSHGAPLGLEDITGMRSAFRWEHEPFDLPDDVIEGWDGRAKGDALEKHWQSVMTVYAQRYPELAAELQRRLAGELPADFVSRADAYISQCQSEPESIASRKASLNTLGTYGPMLPELLGGSADLAGSNYTIWKGCSGIQDNPAGNYIYYGVREFGMTAIANGMALHGGFIPYVATFLIFMEYARNAVRMSALMKQRVIHVYTHDSIGVGEDGPTHQPVEQLASLRTTPNLETWRPCDTVESAVAWKEALLRQQGPTALVFSRQNLPHMARSNEQVQAISQGGYVLRAEDGPLQAIVIATGSEVSLAMAAAEQLSGVRVVSMPCVERFMAQPAAYREQVLPAAIRARVAVEAAHVDYWHKFVGLDGQVIGMTGYGESAPAGKLFPLFGITTEKVVAALQQVMSDAV